MIFWGILLIIVLGIIGYLYAKKQFQENQDDIHDKQHTVETIDADDYFEENATVLNTFKASTSENLLNQAEAIKGFKERGFTDADIYYDYSKEGEFLDEKIASNDETSAHPMYYTVFISDKEEYWIIYLIDDAYYANPLSYNQDKEVATYLSETDSLLSYDNVTDQFYETIPNETMINVVKVNQIDAETLNSIELD